MPSGIDHSQVGLHAAVCPNKMLGADWPPTPYIDRVDESGDVRPHRIRIDTSRQGGGGFSFRRAPSAAVPGGVPRAYGLLHDIDEAEDAVREATFKAWRRLGNPRTDRQNLATHMTLHVHAGCCSGFRPGPSRCLRWRWVRSRPQSRRLDNRHQPTRGLSKYLLTVHGTVTDQPQLSTGCLSGRSPKDRLHPFPGWEFC